MFTELAAICVQGDANPIVKKACVCESLDYCLSWAERTECPAGAQPFETVIKHPWICFGLDTEDDKLCCGFEQRTCDYIEQNR
jgi:hypothetical protein